MSTADSLVNTSPSYSYKDLIQLGSNNAGLSSTLSPLYDGAGNALPIQVSSSIFKPTVDTLISNSSITNGTCTNAILNNSSFDGPNVSWGSFNNSCYGKHTRKITTITTSTSTVAIDPELLTDFVILNVQANVTKFGIAAYSYPNTLSDLHFCRDIYMLIKPNGYSVSMNTVNPMRWSNNGTYPVPSDFGVGYSKNVLVRFIYFHNVRPQKGSQQILNPATSGQKVWVGITLGTNL
jgi:hypothetical protein